VTSPHRPFLVLVILDGWGHSPGREGNAIAACPGDVMRDLASRWPATLLEASGEAVGLPAGVMGNSEVGHLAIGAGRVVDQDLTLLNRTIAAGRLDDNAVLSEACAGAAREGRTLHLLGLVSDAGVHSHVDHLHALVELARTHGVPRVRIHAFTDGRDTPPTSGRAYIAALDAFLRRTGFDAAIATVGGRYFAMDRDRRWDRIEKAWRALARGEGRQAEGPVAAVESAYARGETDEFITPTVLTGVPHATLADGDSVLFFNFRPDRARQLTRALTADEFTEFPRPGRPVPARFVCLTRYDEASPLPVAFPPDRPDLVLGRLFSERGATQLRIAETEKYAHVTYFLNGGVERVYPGEDRILIPSPRIATYDLQPEMSAPEVTRRAQARIRAGETGLVVVNFANADMVGHTGDYGATVQACAVVDRAVGELGRATRERGGLFMVTADHGNAEQMLDPVTGAPHTAHTTNPVPLILVREDLAGARLQAGGGLADVLPTALAALQIPQPPALSGRSLL